MGCEVPESCSTATLQFQKCSRFLQGRLLESAPLSHEGCVELESRLHEPQEPRLAAASQVLGMTPWTLDGGGGLQSGNLLGGYCG